MLRHFDAAWTLRRETMNFRIIALSAASLFLLFAVPIAAAGQYSVYVGTTAYADYEFDYIGDEAEAEEETDEQ